MLAFEFSQSDQAESERKIKRRLRDKKLGAYDQSRIDRIRAFKNDVQRELEISTKSSFYAGSHGNYADLQDWDTERLRHHFIERHPFLPEAAVGQFLPYAIYLYYLR